MVYAKQVIDGVVTMLLAYDYTPDMDGEDSTILIGEEEYNALLAEMNANIPAPDPNKISDRKALEIITGGEV